MNRDVPLKKYAKKMNHSYTFGAFPTIELLKNQPEHVLKVLLHPEMNFLDATVKVNGKDVTLQVGNYSLKLPENKAKALIDGGYDGKTVVMGIRPEDVTDDATAFLFSVNRQIISKIPDGSDIL